MKRYLIKIYNKLIKEEFDCVIESDFNPDMVICMGYDCLEKGIFIGAVSMAMITGIGIIVSKTCKKKELNENDIH